LGKQAFVVLIDKLDRVLDGQYVLGEVAVDIFQKGRKGSGFTRSGGTSNQEKT